MDSNRWAPQNFLQLGRKGESQKQQTNRIRLKRSKPINNKGEGTYLLAGEWVGGASSDEGTGFLVLLGIAKSLYCGQSLLRTSTFIIFTYFLLLMIRDPTIYNFIIFSLSLLQKDNEGQLISEEI